MSFRTDFAWGAATAAYQVEGAAAEDGRGPSVWDQMCRQPGRVFEGHTGDVACDHYHRWEEDIALMRKIGLQAYRFSLSWSRILPEGTGAINERGLAFYDRLVDGLLEAGVEPWLTLFHWDYPLALQRRGGWLNPDSSKWFAEYAQVVTDRLSDRVSKWMTLNEPQCFIGLGHSTGQHAPGDRMTMAHVLVAAHNALLAHGRAVQVIRAGAKTPPTIGWAPTGDVPVPATDSAADRAAADAAYWTVTAGSVWNQTWWMDPVVHGRYPEQGLKAYGADVPAYTDEDMAIIAQPLDFHGLNIYNGFPVAAGPDGKPVRLDRAPGVPTSHMGWRLTPEALYWGSKRFYERYGRPIVITENGFASHDWVALDGAVHDPQRIDYVTRYLRELRRAAADGVDIAAYFYWTLMDNFEWAEGYRYRFGLVHVDFATGTRTMKDSARWYGELIRSRGGLLGD